MKDTVQIKAGLVAGQHDALIDFYGRFNRLFVNKLLPVSYTHLTLPTSDLV